MQTTNNDKPQLQNMPPTYKVLEIDPAKVATFNQRLKEEQNFGLAVFAGGFAAVLSAIVWAIFAVLTGYKTGVAAILVGLAVAFAVRKFGKGTEERFRIVAALCAAFGCLLGNVFAVIALIMQQASVSLFRVLSVWLSQPTVMVESIASIFGAADLLFSGLALYQAYRFSLRIITLQEKESLLSEKPRVW
jgi:hypothetical protein